MGVAGKTAVVTGGGRGIGAAIAERLVNAGARVVIASRSENELTAVCDRSGGPDRIRQFSCDISSFDQVTQLRNYTRNVFGDADILINNAAVQGPIGRFEDAPLDEWWRTIAINLGGVIHCCKVFLPGMLRRGRGKIINVAGGGATAPRPHFSAYAVSKAAVVRFTDNLAAETRANHIDVNAIAPGMVDTRLQEHVIAAGEDAGSEYERIVEAKTSGLGFVSPTVAADLVAFLASSESDGITGKLISAPHDPWREWAGRGPELSSTPMYTLRRLDPFTIGSLKTNS
jgi:3-oxoacyl-[acyl-carrier protein] reductase